MRLFAVILLLQSPLVDIYKDLDVMCRGGMATEQETAQTCAVRLKVENLLRSSGYCYGGPHQDRSQSYWHRCK